MLLGGFIFVFYFHKLALSRRFSRYNTDKNWLTPSQPSTPHTTTAQSHQKKKGSQQLNLAGRTAQIAVPTRGQADRPLYEQNSRPDSPPFGPHT